ncbi:hypothetical protein GY21_19695 [Cryobacterium roopkundense]|uniref:Uncharacterized protein n=1 Tax=Cryobacterium roopkundense TaxID=1001240 RepID=A0A099J0L9_9MICO|nr:hypothetical protein [Cryobacterium roopkundense]KGJ71806.1 hypothetical protein GY21_19695 [Cryobacterium roopkundense]MBB5639971.1 hypothetical protein [Cryobacterium roopkundense]
MMITRLEPNEIFVFGSNATGHHLGGAAADAHANFGAIWGEGHGLHGRSYAIDTMSGLEVLAAEVAAFLSLAQAHAELRFLVTELGCGIGGYSPEQIAPLFNAATDNVMLPARFRSVLSAGRGA